MKRTSHRKVDTVAKTSANLFFWLPAKRQQALTSFCFSLILQLSHVADKSFASVFESSFSLIDGKSVKESTLPNPENRRELSHKKNPRLSGPLVLSGEYSRLPLIRRRRFSIASRVRSAILTASEDDSVAATPSASSRSHCVLTRAMSKKTVTIR